MSEARDDKSKFQLWELLAAVSGASLVLPAFRFPNPYTIMLAFAGNVLLFVILTK